MLSDESGACCAQQAPPFLSAFVFTIMTARTDARAAGSENGHSPASDERELLRLSCETVGRWLLFGPEDPTALWLPAAVAWLATGNAGESLEQLASEERFLPELQKTAYARTCCTGREAFPLSESVFRTGLVMQELRDAARRAYALEGFAAAPGLHEPEDHLGMELLFAAHLLACGRMEALRRFAKERLAWVQEATPLLEKLPQDAGRAALEAAVELTNRLAASALCRTA